MLFKLLNRKNMQFTKFRFKGTSCNYPFKLRNTRLTTSVSSSAYKIMDRQTDKLCYRSDVQWS